MYHKSINCNHRTAATQCTVENMVCCSYVIVNDLHERNNNNNNNNNNTLNLLDFVKCGVLNKFACGCNDFFNISYI